MTEPGENSSAEPKGPEALEDLTLRAAEFSEYLGSYLRTQRDRASSSVKRVMRGIFLAFFFGLLIAGALGVGVAYFFYGIALGLKELFGGREWIAFLTTGGATLLLFGLVIRFGLFGGEKKAVKKQMEDYEDELRAQNQRFGNNALGRAAELAER